MSEQSDAAKKALKNLEPRQRKFVEAFCACFNATKAAETAGYSKKTARQQGYRLLTNVYIKNAVKLVLDTAAMDPEEIAARWTALARAGLDDFYTKQEYEEETFLDAPLAGRIAAIEADDAYDYEFTERSAAVLGLDGDKLALYWDDYKGRQRSRKLDMLRHQMELERNPAATYKVPGGEPIKKYRMVLDLVKAADLGLLDMVKTIAPTEFGLKVELRSPDAALDNLAKWRGMLTTKVDITSGGEKLPASPVLGLLTLEQKKEMLAKMKQVQQEGGAGA
jgi:hypothetical protein